MEEIHDFESFYAARIQPRLKELREQDRQADNWGIIMTILFLAASGSFILNLNDMMTEYGTLITIVLFIFGFLSVYKYFNRENVFIDCFKKNVIAEVVSYLGPGLTYQPEKAINSREYKRSGLFRRYFDYYDGDDFIQGVYKNVAFRSSELHTRYSSGRSTYTIFKGLFFAARINKGYSGGTYVWLNDYPQLPASMADEYYRLMPLPKVYEVKMQHEVFEKYYSVCSTIPSQARTILDEEMMVRILRFRKQIGRPLVLSFVAGYCYVAIPIEEELLEPGNSDPMEKEEVKKYFFTVLLILSIINQLQLNRYS